MTEYGKSSAGSDGAGVSKIFWSAGLAASLAFAAAHGAAAAPSCTGTVSGNLIDPLPKPPSIVVHITDASPENLALGERFKAGLTAAGAVLSDTGNVTMEFATSITGAGDSSSASSAVSPEFGFAGNLPASKDPPVLTMSISVMDTKLAQIDWVGYINCKVRVRDLAAVVYDLGNSVGRSLGKTFPPRPL